MSSNEMVSKFLPYKNFMVAFVSIFRLAITQKTGSANFGLKSYLLSVFLGVSFKQVVPQNYND